MDPVSGDTQGGVVHLNLLKHLFSVYFGLEHFQLPVLDFVLVYYLYFFTFIMFASAIFIFFMVFK